MTTCLPGIEAGEIIPKATPDNAGLGIEQGLIEGDAGAGSQIEIHGFVVDAFCATLKVVKLLSVLAVVPDASDPIPRTMRPNCQSHPI